MTVNRGPGVRQIGAVGTTPKEHRLALAGQYAENAPGVPRSGLLVQAAVNVVTPTGSMSYNVAPVAAVIARTLGEGVYTPTTTGTTAVPTGNAPATGSRWDLVWIKQNDQEKGDAGNAAVLGVTSGTAAASPTKPTGSVPAGAMVLSEHQIFSGTATTTAAPNTTTQVFPITAARGAPIPVRNTTDRATITTPHLGLQVIRLDLPAGMVDTWEGTSWGGNGRIEFTYAVGSGGIPNGSTWGPGAFTLDTSAVTTDQSIATPAGGDRITIAKAGTYAVWFGGAFGNGLNGTSWFQIKDGADAVVHASSPASEFWGSVSIPFFRVAADNTTLWFRLKQTSGSATSASGRVRITRVGA